MQHDIRRRRNRRLRDYNYAQDGGYFVTIVAQDRACIFGQITDGEVRLSDAGLMVKKHWLELPERFSHVALDGFVVMPNHIHGVILLQSFPGLEESPPTARSRAGTSPAPTLSGLGRIVGAFKSITTWQYARGVHDKEWPPFRGRLWQRNYYEHIIRDEEDLLRVRQYIEENAANWLDDEENPTANKGPAGSS